MASKWNKISIEDAKKISKKKQIAPAVIKGTDFVVFSKNNERMKELSWEILQDLLKKKNLQLMEYNGFLKVMKK